ncbi:YbjN domain-containing protein [Actinomycetes bacterium NPDC127524]
MSNIAKFRDFLQTQGIPMNEFEESGNTFFRSEQKLKDGWAVTMVFAFTPGEDIADLFCFNVTEVKNPNKKPAVHELINELNSNYRYSKLYEEDGVISIRYSYFLENDFDPDAAFRRLVMLLETAEEVYPQLMRVIWE